MIPRRPLPKRENANNNGLLRQRHALLSPALTAKLDHLVTEIRTVQDTEDDISIDGQLNQCEYLWACVDELFRLTPTITSPLFRTVFPCGVVVIRDRYPEQGVESGCSNPEIHRNEKFQDPHAFIPPVCGEEGGGEVLDAFQQGEQDLCRPVAGFHGDGTDDCEGRVVLRRTVGVVSLLW
jgi:hypothetical protein